MEAGRRGSDLLPGALARRHQRALQQGRLVRKEGPMFGKGSLDFSRPAAVDKPAPETATATAPSSKKSMFINVLGEDGAEILGESLKEIVAAVKEMREEARERANRQAAREEKDHQISIQRAEIELEHERLKLKKTTLEIEIQLVEMQAKLDATKKKSAK
jgi:hypothetical protein